MQRALLALLWFAATAVATAVSWIGVSAVTGAVSDSPASAIPAARVSALVAPSSTVTTTSVPPPETTSSTVSAASTSTTAAPAPVATSVPPTTTTSVPAPAPPTTATSVAPARSQTATFSTRAGAVTVACDGPSISLLSASPADGYRVEVHDSGPDRVAVSFDADGRQGAFVGAHCVDGAPVRDQPPPTSGPGPGGRDGGDRTH